jgi:hypothetical protein
LTEWWKADLASTSPSMIVTATLTGKPPSDEAANNGLLPVEPWR